jgi:PAS domain S-box-containing protein
MEDRLLAERILDQLADAVIYANRSGEIVRWNHASAGTFGFSAEEAIGQRLDLIIPEHLRAPHWRGFNAAMTNGEMRLQGRPTLTRALHKNGRKLYVEMTFAIVKDDEGQVVGSVAMARDITERVERDREERSAR